MTTRRERCDTDFIVAIVEQLPWAVVETPPKTKILSRRKHGRADIDSNVAVVGRQLHHAESVAGILVECHGAPPVDNPEHLYPLIGSLREQRCRFGHHKHVVCTKIRFGCETVVVYDRILFLGQRYHAHFPGGRVKTPNGVTGGNPYVGSYSCHGTDRLVGACREAEKAVEGRSIGREGGDTTVESYPNATGSVGAYHFGIVGSQTTERHAPYAAGLGIDTCKGCIAEIKYPFVSTIVAQHTSYIFVG